MPWWNLSKLPKNLEDIPTWGQRDYLLYHLDMVTLFIEGRGRGRGRGRREWLSKRPFKRETDRGFG